MRGERRDIDVVALLPLEFLRYLGPFPLECVEAIEPHVPMQVIARALDDEDDLLPHMPVFAGAIAGFQKLHVGLDTALARIQAAVDEMLDQTVGRTLPR